ncbi:MAG: hypothetical protein HC838_01605 [Spirulinaceae cyanobacterium RM2_2_10]|nr:hypothetical protein [Spirulinaceae cyanobacterium RM2_2_10]
MTALLVTERELHSPQELASRLQALNRWHEVETLTRTYADWKLQAWELLCPAERDRLKISNAGTVTRSLSASPSAQLYSATTRTLAVAVLSPVTGTPMALTT